ncbi:MAG: asparagine synthase (glutamine-hydrolyzing) [Opitutae bacterium]|jgi:asparagine synthase (glutamine-hydrolysing)|nr:asparagine synthase (glutamine-hydrolyzing) [Opitutae bacterium]MBT6851570.1 asparagine synthase (glutamine-hydrolyzing) [Opitutae bacterium]
MCGIAAWLSNESISSAVLLQMTNAVTHRGPDGEGYAGLSDLDESLKLCSKDQVASKFMRLALGHRRLSIVDLSDAGLQPMCSASGDLWIIFNGEIYNHPELRVELESEGVSFHSGTDTETVLACWEKWGHACLDRFNGMFAFVIYDQRLKVMHAVRDRFGIKPLYFYRGTGGSSVFFASEIKQFEKIPGWNPKVDSQAAYDFLAWGMQDHGTSTFFKGVSQLAPGERLEIDVGNVLAGEKIVLTSVKWYHLETGVRSDSSLDEAANTLRELMRDSVRLRLRADVEVGSCLSGGIDSSAIVCLIDELMQKDGGCSGQRTFSARAEDPSLDEISWMEMVLKGKKINPSFIMPSFDQLADELGDLIYIQDEPFGSASIFIQNLVFSLANAAGVKVVLDGQGADELFGGYVFYRSCTLAGLISKGRFVEAICEIMHLRKAGVSLRRTSMEVGDYLMPDVLRQRARSFFGKNHVGPSWLNLDKLGVRGSNVPAEYGGRARSVGELNYAQVAFTSLPKLLHWEDRNSMGWSVEGRVPFLDYRLVEFAMGLPDEVKVSQGTTKRVLRDAMQCVLPEKVVARHDKIGFAASDTEWFVRKRSDWFLSKIDKTVELGAGLFGLGLKAEAERMVKDGAAFDSRYWRALCFSEWLDRFSVSLD